MLSLGGRTAQVAMGTYRNSALNGALCSGSCLSAAPKTVFAIRTLVVLLFLGLAGTVLCFMAVRVSSAKASTGWETLTNYPNFERLCTAFVTSYEAMPGGAGARLPVLGRHKGNCSADRRPIVLSVTHENAHNSHADAANYDRSIASYMSDLHLDQDLGRWVDIGMSGNSDTISILIDTVNFEKINVTGWPIQYGHMFAAFNDHLREGATADQEIVLELDVRVWRSQVHAKAYQGYSGNRVIVGAVGNWTEPPPRTNRIHFFETDLIQSHGYSASYHDPDYPLCKDVNYDRCFYNPEGKFAEGREVGYAAFFRQPPVPANTESWTHLRIPLSQAIRRLRWAAPPAQWGDARISGVYIGVESQGAAVTAIDVRNYNVFAEKG
jgi:hypothetical protein